MNTFLAEISGDSGGALAGGAVSLFVAVLLLFIGLLALLMPIFIWQINGRMKLLEQRAYAMRKMMRLCEDHLRVMRVMQTGEQLEPRDPTL